MTRVTAVYFSPTQGTKKYTEALAAALDADFQSIDLTLPQNRSRSYQFGSEDLVVFGAPVYAGRLPFPEEGLFERLAGNGTPAVFTVVYGNRDYDDALLEMKDMCEARGFSGIAAAAWIAEHTYSEKLAGGRPNETDLQEAAAFAEKIKAVLHFLEQKKEEAETRLDVPGNRPYKEAKRMPKLTETTEFCTGCGRCARLCPAAAISEDADMEADQTRCIGCLRCVKLCPRGGRTVADPSIDAIRAKLEPVCGGIHKEAEYFLLKAMND